MKTSRFTLIFIIIITNFIKADEIKIKIPKDVDISALAFHPSENVLTCAFKNGTIRFLDINGSFQHKTTLWFDHILDDGLGESIQKLAYMPDGNFLVSYHGNNNIKIWANDKIIDFKYIFKKNSLIKINSEPICEWEDYSEETKKLDIYAFAINPIPTKRNTFIIALKEKSKVSIWELNLYSKSPNIKQIFEIPISKIYLNHGLVFSPSGNLLAISENYHIHIWKLDFDNINNSNMILKIDNDHNEPFLNIEFGHSDNILTSIDLWHDDSRAITWRLDLSSKTYDEISETMIFAEEEVFFNSNKMIVVKETNNYTAPSLCISTFNPEVYTLIKRTDNSFIRNVAINQNMQYFAFEEKSYSYNSDNYLKIYRNLEFNPKLVILEKLY